MDYPTSLRWRMQVQVRAYVMAVNGQRSGVWEHYSVVMDMQMGDGGVMEARWAKCQRCNYKARCEPVRGTTGLWNHLKNYHHYDTQLRQFRAPEIGEGSNANDDINEVLDANDV
ncbi:hypothetical protein EJB05_55828, partial [Eragrostis curvula]